MPQFVRQEVARPWYKTGAVTSEEAVAFVERHGLVLESAHGPIPDLAEAVAGEPIRGSWWGHPRAREILLCRRAVRASPDVLVCRVAHGKVTYVHRRLWPALVRLAQRFDASRLASVQEVHTPSGRHEVQTTAYPDWLPAEVHRAAQDITEAEAARLLRSLNLPARS